MTTRKSLPLTADDLRALDRLRTSESHRAAVERLTGLQLDDAASNAQLLHALLAVGWRTVEEAVQAEGYAALAADPEYQEFHAESRRISRRRRPAWADED